MAALQRLSLGLILTSLLLLVPVVVHSYQHALHIARPRSGHFSLLSVAGNSESELQKAIVKIGTRASPLALAQAYETKRLLEISFPELASAGAVAIKKIMTKVTVPYVVFIR
jgi:hypothetical protein